MAYYEIKQHGTADFPFQLYCVDEMHPKYSMAHHWHSELEIIRIISGKLAVTLSDRAYVGKDGDVFVVNSGVIHSAMPHDCVYECIVFDVNFFAINKDFEMFASSLINRDGFVNEYFPKNNTKFHFLVDELFVNMREAKKGYMLSAAGLILRIFGEIEENNYYSENVYKSAENVKNIHKLKKVLEFIRNSYFQQIALEDMAKAAGMSPKYFCSFFKTMTSKTPVEYLNSHRIERAAHRLLITDDSITDIAYDCGFNDLSYFIKVFKDEKQITPKQFRAVGRTKN